MEDCARYRHLIVVRDDYRSDSVHRPLLRIILTDEGRELIREGQARWETNELEYARRMAEAAPGTHATLHQEIGYLRARPPFMLWYDLIEEMVGNGWYCFSDQDLAQIGALTSNPYVIAQVAIGDDGIDTSTLAGVWAYEPYMLRDICEELLKQSVVLEWYPFE